MKKQSVENWELMPESERLSWLLAGVSTAVLGYLKPEESYANMPLELIEEAIRLRVSFQLACEALKPFYQTSRGQALTTNDLMCEFLRNAEKRIKEIRKVVIREV
jgi:hypothetical protein